MDGLVLLRYMYCSVIYATHNVLSLSISLRPLRHLLSLFLSLYLRANWSTTLSFKERTVYWLSILTHCKWRAPLNWMVSTAVTLTHQHVFTHVSILCVYPPPPPQWTALALSVSSLMESLWDKLNSRKTLVAPPNPAFYVTHNSLSPSLSLPLSLSLSLPLSLSHTLSLLPSLSLTPPTLSLSPSPPGWMCAA